jgi:PIN domain nuclease of toxin-antitoxin system
MNLLLDTHILLWWLADPMRLSAASRRAIRDTANKVYVSAAVAWEIAIKRILGKLESPDNLDEVMAQNGFQPLSITIAHAMAVRSLPMHHRDPFDRMLIAQALQEGLQLVSRDSQFSAYGVSLLMA